MRTPSLLLALLILLLPACATYTGSNPMSSDTSNMYAQTQNARQPGYVSWGVYDLHIARDGSSYSVVPRRSAEDYDWGYHLNAVKLLEVSPGKNCVKIARIEILDNGDLAVDISITHPYSNPIYTGFDVRGIIMFPSSQYIPDNELREKAGLEPCGMWWERYATHKKGDAELMNPDGYTTIFAPDDPYQWGDYYIEEGYPIFEYYEGRMASGDELGVINGYKRYYSNETRHMFEVNETVTQTFVIRPPVEGPIEASYAVYAHWCEPLRMPVTDPLTDFGPEANSPMPYEFWVEQTGPLDPDAPDEVNAQNVVWHIKYWDWGPDTWYQVNGTLLNHGAGYALHEAFDICPDCYLSGFYIGTYHLIPDALPGSWHYNFFLVIHDPKELRDLAVDWYICDFYIEAKDGEW